MLSSARPVRVTARQGGVQVTRLDGTGVEAHTGRHDVGHGHACLQLGTRCARHVGERDGRRGRGTEAPLDLPDARMRVGALTRTGLCHCVRHHP
jgi:hypothetical protein